MNAPPTFGQLLILLFRIVTYSGVGCRGHITHSTYVLRFIIVLLMSLLLLFCRNLSTVRVSISACFTNPNPIYIVLSYFNKLTFTDPLLLIILLIVGDYW